MAQVDLQRTFHPVGQGAFYTEVFIGEDGHRFVMVYDCGTKTNNDDLDVSLDDQIAAFKKSIEPHDHIDALFLSHFHVDHISGLDKLLENIRVRYTIIPMLTLPGVTITRVQNFIDLKNDFDDAHKADNIIKELYLTKQQSDKFGKVFVVEWDTVKPEGEIERDIQQPERLGIGEVIPNGKAFPAMPIWEYVPFNSIKANDQRAIIFLNGLRQIDGAMHGDDLNVEGLVRGFRKKVRNLYKQVLKGEDDNLYTLVVESRPVQGVSPTPDRRASRCLYMGDFYWKGSMDLWARFQSAYDYDDIGTIQVPHHGSKENWNDDLLSGKERCYVISAGTKNTYHHPDFWVVKSIWDSGHGTKVVSEKAASKSEQSFFMVV